MPSQLVHVFFGLLVAIVTAARAGTVASTEGIVPGEYMVRVKENISSIDFAIHLEWVKSRCEEKNKNLRELKSFNGRPKTDPKDEYKVYSSLYTSYHGKFDDDTLMAIQEQPIVVSVSPGTREPWPVHWVGETFELEPDATISMSNDEGAEDETTRQHNASWNLAAISHKGAIPLSSPDFKEYLYELPSGGPTYAYVLDSGIMETHNEFRGREIERFDATGGKLYSDKAHGTHIAGMIGGAKYGIAKNVTLVDVQVGSTQGLNYLALAHGLEWSLHDILTKDRLGRSVINVSAGCHLTKDTLTQLQRLTRAGIPVVMAAGNANADSVDTYPANYSKAITVAAMAKDYKRSEYSNWGSVVDLFAPGDHIPAAGIRSNSDIITRSGNSMAAPHVAGVIAYLFDVEGPRKAAEIWARLEKLSTKKVVEDASEAPNRLLFNGNRPGSSYNPERGWSFWSHL